MGTWYTVGLFAGLGVALGILLAGIVPRQLVAPVLGAIAGAVLGYLLHGWPEAVGGGIGGVSGGWGATSVVVGALRRGGTRGGVAALVAGIAVVAAGLAFVPVLGYLEVVALPVLGLRLRSREPDRHAGLRTLARD